MALRLQPDKPVADAGQRREDDPVLERPPAETPGVGEGGGLATAAPGDPLPASKEPHGVSVAAARSRRQVGLQARRRQVELRPGDPHGTPSGGLKDAVALPVSLERRAREVEGAAVELDDHPLLARCDAVDLEALDDRVGLGLGEAGGVEELKEAQLELAAGQLLARPARARARPDGPAAGTPRVRVRRWSSERRSWSRSSSASLRARSSGAGGGWPRGRGGCAGPWSRGCRRRS